MAWAAAADLIVSPAAETTYKSQPVEPATTTGGTKNWPLWIVHSQAQERDSQAAEIYSCPCDGVSKTLHASRKPHTKYASPNAASSHAAKLPRKDSTNSSFLTARPSTTELNTWPTPHNTAVRLVFPTDHSRAQDIMAKGKEND